MREGRESSKYCAPRARARTSRFRAWREVKDVAFNRPRPRFVAPDFERDERNAPDLRALNWLSVANRRSSLQTSFYLLFYLSFSSYLGEYIIYAQRNTLA